MTSSGTTEPPHHPWWIALGLILLLLWAGASRIWMASSGLASGHYWDERYSVKNLRPILEGGTLEPANYYYQSLSYLPQAAVLAAVEGASGVFGEPFSFFADGGFRPSGYFLCRLIQVLYSLGTLLLTFLIGRRLISAEAGLVAAILLAVAPQHVRLSTMWKPDITLLLAILLALWWTLDALDRPSLGRYLLAGAGVGLALASKLNGGPIAAPLAIGAVVAGVRDRRHWRGLVAAGITAAIVFLVLNPRVGRYLDALERNQQLYSRQVRGADPTLPERIAQVAREEVGFVVSANFHGPWIGIAAIAGLAAIAAVALRRRDRRSVQRALAVLAFPVVYTAIYAASTPYAKENNFLQILPFTALAASFLLALGWSRLAPLVPQRARGPATAIAMVALALAVAAPTQAWVYRTQVPDTWELAIETVTERLRPWNGRVAYVEASREDLGPAVRRTKGLLRPVDDLAALPRDLLDQADAELFSVERLAGDGGFHRDRVAAAEASTVTRFEPRWFVARGPAIVGILRPREAAGSWTVEAAATDEGLYRIDLPPTVAGEMLSAEVWRRRQRAPQPEPEILIGGRPLRLHALSAGALTGWLSERFPIDSEALTARLDPVDGDQGEIPVRIYGWR